MAPSASRCDGGRGRATINFRWPRTRVNFKAPPSKRTPSTDTHSKDGTTPVTLTVISPPTWIPGRGRMAPSGSRVGGAELSIRAKFGSLLPTKALTTDDRGKTGSIRRSTPSPLRFRSRTSRPCVILLLRIPPRHRRGHLTPPRPRGTPPR